MEDFIVYRWVNGGEADVAGEEDQQGEGNCASISLGLTGDGRKHGRTGRRQVHTGKGDSDPHRNLLVIVSSYTGICGVLVRQSLAHRGL